MLPRALIALLLTMNIGVALWIWLRPAAEPVVPVVTHSEVAALQLLSEVESAEASLIDEAEPDGPPEPSPSLDRQVCLEIGPFLTQADLRRAMNALTPAAERLQFRETRGLANRGYWVFLPAHSSRDAALASARELSAKGLRDYYVVTGGERENTVSLGLFRELSNAQSRHAEVTKLGFDAQLQQRSDEIPNYWVDLAVEKEFDWQSQIQSYSGVEGKQVACQ